MKCYCLFYSDTPLRCLLIKYLWKRLFLASVFLHHQRNFSFSPTRLSFLLLVFSKFFMLSTWYSTLRVFSHNFVPSSVAFSHNIASLPLWKQQLQFLYSSSTSLSPFLLLEQQLFSVHQIYAFNFCGLCFNRLIKFSLIPPLISLLISYSAL